MESCRLHRRLASPSFSIHRRVGDLGQGFIGLLLFRERLIERLGRVFHPQLGCLALQRTVSRNFVMLDCLCRSEKASIKNGKGLSLRPENRSPRD